MLGLSVRQPVLVCSLAFLLFAFIPATQADWVSEYCGYTVMSDNNRAHGIVNFAVWKPGAGDTDWTDDFSWDYSASPQALSGSPPVDKEVTYVLFYQLVNYDFGENDEIDTFTITVPKSFVTSVGKVDDNVLEDADGDIRASNEVLGTDSSSYSDDLADDGNPSAKNRVPTGSDSNPGIDGNTSAIPPSSVTIGTSETTISWTQHFPEGYFSTIVWLTTDAPYLGYAKGMWTDTDKANDPSSDGDVPVPTPEPSPILLAIFGVAGLGLLNWHRSYRAIG
jgi:hypothetical protein